MASVLSLPTKYECAPQQGWPPLADTEVPGLDMSTNVSTTASPVEGLGLRTPSLGGHGDRETIDAVSFAEGLGCMSPLSLSAPDRDPDLSPLCSSVSVIPSVEGTDFPLIPTSIPASTLQQRRPPSACTCLNELAGRLRHMTALSRQLIGLDTALSRTEEALVFAEDIAACQFCRLDGGKVLLPTIALLSKTFNLAKVSYYSHDATARPQQRSVFSPAVYFGEWELSDEEDMRMVTRVLVHRTASRASAVVGALRLRTEQFVVAMECQFMDSAPLRRGIQRLVGALGEFAACIRGFEGV